MSKNYVTCKHCGYLSAEVDKSQMLMSSPPQFAARCNQCNTITYIPAAFSSHEDLWHKPGALTMEQKVEDLMLRVAALEARLAAQVKP